MRKALMGIGAVAFAVALAACDDGGGGAGGPASSTPDPGFLTGIEEAWSVPGTYYGTSESGDLLAVSDSFVVSVYPLADEKPEPLWSGECDSFGFFGERLVCGGEVVDVESGEATPFVDGAARFMHANSEYLVVLTDEPRLVGIDADLNEEWSRDGLFYPMGGAGPRTLSILPEGADYSAVELVDITTGETLVTGPAQELADGYVYTSPEPADGSGPAATGVNWSGEEVFSMPISVRNYRLPLAPAGQMLSLADAQECFNVDEPAPADTTLGFCLVSGETVIAGNSTEDSTIVDGVAYPAGFSPLLFVDTEHIVIMPTPAPMGDSATTLHALGNPEPIWTAPIPGIPTLTADGAYMLGITADSTVVLRPAG